MAGVFTDNQPDFGFLLPGEVRTFSQFWYPLVGTGPAHEANLEAAVHLEREGDGVRLGVAVTRPLEGAIVRLSGRSGPIFERVVDLAPERPLADVTVALPDGVRVTDLRLAVLHDGAELVSYQPRALRRGDPPPPATEPPPPAHIESLEELWLTGMHLQQYRHATRRPEDYSTRRCAETQATAAATRPWASGTCGVVSTPMPNATCERHSSGSRCAMATRVMAKPATCWA